MASKATNPLGVVALDLLDDTSLVHLVDHGAREGTADLSVTREGRDGDDAAAAAELLRLLVLGRSEANSVVQLILNLTLCK